MDKKIRLLFNNSDRVSAMKIDAILSLSKQFTSEVVVSSSSYGRIMVEIDSVPSDPDQLAILVNAMRENDGWCFAGPDCEKDATHPPMTSSDDPRFGPSWACFERRCFHRISRSGQPYMNWRDFQLLFMTTFQRPGSKLGDIREAMSPKPGHTYVTNNITQEEARIHEHIVTAMRTETEPMQHVLPTETLKKSPAVLYDGSGDFPIKPTPKHVEKARNLATAYGMGAKRYAELIDKQQEESEAIINRYLELFPMLKEKYGPKEAPKDPDQTLVTSADKAFQFFAGLNLQDHSLAEQREYETIMRELKAVLVAFRKKTDGR